MIQYRLVVDSRKHSWGSEGLELTDKYYFLQARTHFISTYGQEICSDWQTLPVVSMRELSEKEKKEVTDAILIKPELREELK